MSFEFAEWLLLLPLLALMGWRWRALRLEEPLRAGFLLCLVLLLAGLRLKQGGQGTDLWVLVDRSQSTQRMISRNWTEWRHLLEKSRGAGDRLYVVNYATSAHWEEEAAVSFEDSGRQTRTGLALDYALARARPGRTTRLLLLSDGFHTEPLGNMLEKLRSSEVALDYLLVRQPEHEDLQVESFELPTRVQSGEAFLISARLRGTPDQSFRYRVLVGEQEILSGETRLENGEAWLRFTDRLSSPGAFPYRIQVQGEKDRIPENNEALRWIEVGGEAR
ncbi:MAG: VWA domain-containing protein, partial [Blastochloris sp.]|nr:VWA domain-containing protein [Blastochloris sp.]